MRHRSAASLFQGEARLRAIERLNLALFICAKDDRVFRRVQVQPNDGIELFGEFRIVADLEGAD
jgi:hypothetical protein